MPQVNLKSTLLVPAPKFAAGSFLWIDTFKSQSQSLNGYNETVDVIVFNCNDRDGIVSILKQELDKLKTLENPSENAANNIAFIEKTLSGIKTDMEHEAPDALLQVVMHSSGMNFRAQDVIYLSGVESIYE